MPNGMPPVTAIVSPGLANPSRVTIAQALSTISDKRPNSWTWTACVPQTKASRRAVAKSGVRLRIGAAGRSRA